MAFTLIDSIFDFHRLYFVPSDKELFFCCLQPARRSSMMQLTLRYFLVWETIFMHIRVHPTNEYLLNSSLIQASTSYVLDPAKTS